MTPEEERIVRERLGRKPNDVEHGMLDIMWSEHCSYKSSKAALAMLPTKSERVICGPGYDAGVVDIGNGWAVAFKIESHNHPSAVEPFNGAATGIGGIVRDILAMGAKPVALLDPLRFGTLQSGRSRWLFEHVVEGISAYGNCIGVPTVAGEIEFDGSFEENCLVNVACYGYVRRERMLTGNAKQAGNLLALAGGSTGRDGIHGVTFASKALSEESEADRPAVQIGDPFTKKLLIDACLECNERGLIVSLKDLGGGGLTCACSEMCAKGNMGAELDIGALPVREKGMNAYELMLSESQERMLIEVREADYDALKRIFDKYETSCVAIGRLTAAQELVVKHNGSVVARLPPKLITEAPLAKREAKEPKHIAALRSVKQPAEPSDYNAVLLSLLACENIASKEWVTRQYDSEVQLNTLVKPGADAAVLRAPNGRAIALKADCNSKHCYLDPYNGGAGAVAEAGRNVASVGAVPIAMVDNCNFGNPEKPESFWYFSESVRGMADACKALNIPCVGGNVSFYNEAGGVAIKPAPVVAVLGLVERQRGIALGAAQSIVLVGETLPEMGGSEYYESYHRLTGGVAPKVDFAREKGNMEFVLSIDAECVHDVSKGGIAVALAEMCIAGNTGASVDLSAAPSKCSRDDELLFSETHARYLIGTKNADAVMDAARSAGVPAAVIGKSGGSVLRIEGRTASISTNVATAKEGWKNAIPNILGREVGEC
jgi:phosphoribosylformylglycinamidine synthase